MGVDTIVQLLRFCLKSTAFQYKGTHYKQLDDIATGSPVSRVIADVFMENLEDIAFKTGDVEPRVWRQFVDDVIAVVHDKYGETLLEHLNKQHP